MLPGGPLRPAAWRRQVQDLLKVRNPVTRAAEVGSSANGSGGRPRRVLPRGRAYGLDRSPGIRHSFCPTHRLGDSERAHTDARSVRPSGPFQPSAQCALVFGGECRDASRGPGSLGRGQRQVLGWALARARHRGWDICPSCFELSLPVLAASRCP